MPVLSSNAPLVRRGACRSPPRASRSQLGSRAATQRRNSAWRCSGEALRSLPTHRPRHRREGAVRGVRTSPRAPNNRAVADDEQHRLAPSSRSARHVFARRRPSAHCARHPCATPNFQARWRGTIACSIDLSRMNDWRSKVAAAVSEAQRVALDGGQRRRVIRAGRRQFVRENARRSTFMTGAAIAGLSTDGSARATASQRLCRALTRSNALAKEHLPQNATTLRASFSRALDRNPASQRPHRGRRK
jgi:hypothetical protein